MDVFWDKIVAAASGPPSQLAFRFICAQIDAWPDSGSLGGVIDLARERTRLWPDQMCGIRSLGSKNKIPLEMLVAAPSWPLIRSISCRMAEIVKRPQGIDLSHLSAVNLIVQKSDPPVAWPDLGTLMPGLRFLSLSAAPHDLRDFELWWERMPASLESITIWGLFDQQWPVFVAWLHRRERSHIKSLCLWDEPPRLLFEGPLPPLEDVEVSYRPGVWAAIDSHPTLSRSVRRLAWNTERREGGGLRELSRCTNLNALDSIEPFNCAISDVDLLSLVEGSHISQLRALTLGRNIIENNEILGGLRFARLERLNLGGLRLCDKIATVIIRGLESTNDGSLRQLDLAQNNLGDATMIALAESPAVRNLTLLNLSNSDIGDEALTKFLELKQSPHLQELNIAFSRASERAAAVLLATTYMTDLRDLSIEGLPISPACLKQGAEQGILLQLERLAMGWDEFGDKECHALIDGIADSTRLRDLELVGVGDRLSIGSEWICRLVNSPWFGRLWSFHLDVEKVDAAVIQCLKDARGPFDLARFSLQSWDHPRRVGRWPEDAPILRGLDEIVCDPALMTACLKTKRLRPLLKLHMEQTLKD